MEISVIGLSHLTAPVEVRERLALPPGLARQLLCTAREESIVEEAMVLNTCNRTEIYCVTPARDWDVEHLLAHAAQLKGQTALAADPALYRREGIEAVRHLFRVAASLDSQVVGEHEIIGQVKAAYRQAIEARTAKFLLHKLLHRAFHVSARVVSETGLCRGTASVAQAAVDLAGQIFTRLGGKTVLLVGAGQTAELAAAALVRGGVSSLIVANRTLARAQQLAEDLRRQHESVSVAMEEGGEIQPDQVTCPALRKLIECSLEERRATEAPGPLRARAVALSEIHSVIAEADLVISSTGSGEPVLTADTMRASAAGRRHPLLMIDLAVPRDIDPRVSDLPNVFLNNIDDLEGIVQQNIQRRRQDIPRAEAIVNFEAEQFARWMESLSVVPTIKLLQQRIEALLADEVRRYGRKFPAGDADQLQRFARSLSNKILHSPIAFLREASNKGIAQDDPAAIDLFRRMFDLDASEEDQR